MSKEITYPIFTTNIDVEELEVHQQAILFSKDVFIKDNKLYRNKKDIGIYWSIYEAMEREKNKGTIGWNLLWNFNQHLSKDEFDWILSNNDWINSRLS